MKLDDYALDKVHQICCAELGELDCDGNAVTTLHALYTELRSRYIAVFTGLREKVAT